MRTAPAYLAAAGAGLLTQMLVAQQSLVLLPAAALVVLACHAAYATWFRQIAERRASATAPALT
jgi:hypothetical protein